MWLLLKNLLFTVLVPGFTVGWVPWVFLLRRAPLPAGWTWPLWLAAPPLFAGALVYGASAFQLFVVAYEEEVPRCRVRIISC